MADAGLRGNDRRPRSGAHSRAIGSRRWSGPSADSRAPQDRGPGEAAHMFSRGDGARFRRLLDLLLTLKGPNPSIDIRWA
jgi:hypothetical protein